MDPNIDIYGDGDVIMSPVETTAVKMEDKIPVADSESIAEIKNKAAAKAIFCNDLDWYRMSHLGGLAI